MENEIPNTTLNRSQYIDKVDEWFKNNPNQWDEIYKKEHLTQKSVLGNMWANVNYPGGYNRPHLHPNALFSGVYWI